MRVVRAPPLAVAIAEEEKEEQRLDDDEDDPGDPEDQVKEPVDLAAVAGNALRQAQPEGESPAGGREGRQGQREGRRGRFSAGDALSGSRICPG